jgi:hypothetical protein
MNNGGLACTSGYAEKISAKDRLIRNNFFYCDQDRDEKFLLTSEEKNSTGFG